MGIVAAVCLDCYFNCFKSWSRVISSILLAFSCKKSHQYCAFVVSPSDLLIRFLRRTGFSSSWIISKFLQPYYQTMSVRIASSAYFLSLWLFDNFSGRQSIRGFSLDYHSNSRTIETTKLHLPHQNRESQTQG